MRLKLAPLHYRQCASLFFLTVIFLAQAQFAATRSMSAQQQAPTLVKATTKSLQLSTSSSGSSSSSGSGGVGCGLLPPNMPKGKFNIETNSLQRYSISDLAAGGAPHSLDYNRSLKRVFLSNRTITCNDGSQAGFYLRKNPNSKKWIVFLEGGWHCYDTRSCRARWLRLRHLMTSAQWPETRDVGGILSPLPEENPYWHKANHVLVPYCSSDSWSGTRTATMTGSEAKGNNWRFMGALILRQVIADLIPLGLGRVPGAELLLVGSSAGGLGVMLNLNRITEFLVNERKLMVMVRGVSDSGWFLDREPYLPAAIASSESVRQGWKLWQGLLPEECTKQHAAEPWRCYFGYHLYPSLKSPLFVFQWLFDEAQMRADNVGAPVTPQQWNYIHEMGGALRSSLDNVTAVFAPSCIGHAVLSKREWVHIKIDDISLPAALRCWQHATRPPRKLILQQQQLQQQQQPDKLKRSTEATLKSDDESNTVDSRQRKHRHRNNKHNDAVIIRQHHKSNTNDAGQHLTKEQRAERKRLRHEAREKRREQRQRRRNRQRNKHDDNNNTNDAANRERKHRRRNRHQHNKNANNATRQRKLHSVAIAATEIDGLYLQDTFERQHLMPYSQTSMSSSTSSSDTLYALETNVPQQHYYRNRNSNNNHGNSANKNNNSNNSNNHVKVPRVPEKCSMRLLERCSWPQCNHSCPSLTNPLTGEEMRFLELLTSFGLDIEAVAAALGVDMNTLNNMDRTELVNLLTQQVS